MGMQDRDYYKDHWRAKQGRAATAKVKAPKPQKVPAYIGPMPRWAKPITCFLLVYGAIGLVKDLLVWAAR